MVRSEIIRKMLVTLLLLVLGNAGAALPLRSGLPLQGSEHCQLFQTGEDAPSLQDLGREDILVTSPQGVVEVMPVGSHLSECVPPHAVEREGRGVLRSARPLRGRVCDYYVFFLYRLRL